MRGRHNPSLLKPVHTWFAHSEQKISPQRRQWWRLRQRQKGDRQCIQCLEVPSGAQMGARYASRNGIWLSSSVLCRRPPNVTAGKCFEVHQKRLWSLRMACIFEPGMDLLEERHLREDLIESRCQSDQVGSSLLLMPVLPVGACFWNGPAAVLRLCLTAEQSTGALCLVDPYCGFCPAGGTADVSAALAGKDHGPSTLLGLVQATASGSPTTSGDRASVDNAASCTVFASRIASSHTSRSGQVPVPDSEHLLLELGADTRVCELTAKDEIGRVNCKDSETGAWHGSVLPTSCDGQGAQR